jgi:hypothetical protein
VLVGSFVLATSVVLALLAYRPAVLPEPALETNDRREAIMPAMDNLVTQLEGTA